MKFRRFCAKEQFSAFCFANTLFLSRKKVGSFGFDKAFVVPDKLIHLTKTSVSNGGVTPGYANAGIKWRMLHHRDLQCKQTPRGCPGGWVPLELIGA